MAVRLNLPCQGPVAYALESCGLREGFREVVRK
jgi:hypothetical protein